MVFKLSSPPLQNIPPPTDPEVVEKLRKALGINQLDLFRGQRDMFAGLDNVLDRVPQGMLGRRGLSPSNQS